MLNISDIFGKRCCFWLFCPILACFCSFKIPVWQPDSLGQCIDLCSYEVQVKNSTKWQQHTQNSQKTHFYPRNCKKMDFWMGGPKNIQKLRSNSCSAWKNISEKWSFWVFSAILDPRLRICHKAPWLLRPLGLKGLKNQLTLLILVS